MLIFYQLFLWLKSIREVTSFKIFTLSRDNVWSFVTLACSLWWRITVGITVGMKGMWTISIYNNFSLLPAYNGQEIVLVALQHNIFECSVMSFRHRHAPVVVWSWPGHLTDLLKKIIFWNRSPWFVLCLNLS